MKRRRGFVTVLLATHDLLGCHGVFAPDLKSHPHAERIQMYLEMPNTVTLQFIFCVGLLLLLKGS